MNLPGGRLYTVTGMDVATDFVTGIWVVAVEVATVGVGSADKIGFTGRIWVGGHRLGDYPYLKSSLYWCFGSPLLFSLFGSGTFLGEEFVLGEGTLVCGWLLMLLSSSKYVFIFLVRDGYGQNLVLHGLQNMVWVVQSLLNMWTLSLFWF